MAAVDSFHLLYRQVAWSCQSHMEFLAVVGALYTAGKGLKLICQSYNLIRLHITPLLFSRTNLGRQYGAWAVVTGATSGIAQAYAEELARCGMNVVLVDNNREKLQKMSDSITATHGVNTSFIEVDFCKGHEAYRPIKDALRHVEVGILVNCVGNFLEYPQSVIECPEEQLWKIIHVSVSAATIMAKIVVPGMAQRRRGAIVNVSFRSCCKPNFPMTMYTPCQLYMDGFTKELQSELSSKGIFVQSLTPLCVAKERTLHYRPSFRFPFLVPSPEVYARHAVQMLGVSHRTTGYWAHSMQLAAACWLPDFICQLMGRFLHTANC
uniref:3-ketoacyl-CoA reductase n=1 Tax=Xenopus tropicalis TaxID=8364 RepID=A0A803KA58_XENTR